METPDIPFLENTCDTTEGSIEHTDTIVSHTTVEASRYLTSIGSVYCTCNPAAV